MEILSASLTCFGHKWQGQIRVCVEWRGELHIKELSEGTHTDPETNRHKELNSETQCSGRTPLMSIRVAESTILAQVICTV